MIKAIDFFCGAGGLTRGLLDSGIDVRAGVDIDESLKLTYESNNSPSKFIQKSINDIDIIKTREELNITEDDIVLYAACTPCQPFSTLNRMKGEDKRKILLIAFAEIIKKSPPDFIIVENVPGLSNAYGREIYDEFIKILKNMGFNHVFQEKLDAADYGVPQIRKRFILIASRHGTIVPPESTANRSSIADFIKKYPPIADGELHENISNHESRAMQPHHRKIVKAIPKNGGSRKDIEDTSILLKCHQEKPDVHKDVFGRMSWDKPAPTLTARCADVYCGRFVHPEQDRGISLREAAALQTFRDDYVFHGKFHGIQRQIGNAVPVELARRIGKSVIATARKGLAGVEI